MTAPLVPHDYWVKHLIHLLDSGRQGFLIINLETQFEQMSTLSFINIIVTHLKKKFTVIAIHDHGDQGSLQMRFIMSGKCLS